MPRIAAALLLVMGAAQPGGPLVAQERSAGEAWAIEAAGGALGSAAGFGLGLLLVDDDCGEDIVCILEDVAAVVGVASAGSALGAVVLGRAADTDPSIGGAAVGAIAGAFAGLGMLKVVEEIDPGLDDGAPAMITFTLSQGIVTGLGSRVGAALR